MNLLRHLIWIFFILPGVIHSQDTVLLSVYGYYNPQLEILGYRMHLFIDETHAVCDPYTGKITPEDQVRIFKDSLSRYGVDLSKLIYEGHALRYPDFHDDFRSAPHPNVVQRYLLEGLRLEQIRDVQAMATMLYIEIGDIEAIMAFPKGFTKDSIVIKALENAKVQAALIADAMQMKVLELVEVNENSHLDDPRYSDRSHFYCSGSVWVKAALISK